MSFGDAPTAPDPTTTSNAQQQYNINAGTAQQNLNMVDQTNPLGSLSYTQTGTNADGTPKYNANTSYSQPVQSILDNYLKTQNTTGNTASNLAANSAGMYSQPANITGDQTFKQLQGRITSLEESIADRRELYNDQVNLNNIRVKVFPDVLIAQQFGFRPAQLLEFSQEEKRDVDTGALFRA